MPKLTTLADGSVLMTWPNGRGGIDSEQYVVHRGHLWIVSHRGALVPAFNGLRILHKETVETAVRRGLAGERGTPPIDWSHVARVVLAGAAITATYLLVRP